MLADGIIIQQYSVAHDWQARYPKKNITYIPLGNYIGAYGNTSRSIADIRREFELNEQDLVILSFGIVKPYKKIDEIIRIFQRNVAVIDPRIKLCIVGTATKEYAVYINKLVVGNTHIMFKNMFVKDEDMADVLGMADYSIFWYDDSVLTSGGLALVLSYGLPAIIRDIPAAERIRNGQNGFLFDTAERLVGILKKLPNISKPSREQVVGSIADDSWAALAPRYAALYEGLFSPRS